jgi:hypothetical protein
MQTTDLVHAGLERSFEKSPYACGMADQAIVVPRSTRR